MRTAINIDDCRIFLVGVIVYRFYQTIIKICLSVGRFNGAKGDFGHIVSIHRIGSSQQIDIFSFTRSRNNVDITRDCGRSIVVYHIFTACRQLYIVHPILISDETALSGFYIHGVCVAL